MGAKRLAVLLCLLRGRKSDLCQIDVSRQSISLFSFLLRFKVNLEDILGQGGRVPPEKQGRL